MDKRLSDTYEDETNAIMIERHYADKTPITELLKKHVWNQFHRGALDIFGNQNYNKTDKAAAVCSPKEEQA